MTSSTLILVFLLSAFPLAAALRSFPEENISLEFPAEWVKSSKLPTEVSAGMESPDEVRKVFVSIVKLAGRDWAVAAASFRTGVKNSLVKQGYQIDPEQSSTIAGLPFVSFTARMPPSGSLVTRTTTADGKVYGLVSLLAGEGNAANDPELLSITQSFKFLTPPESLVGEPAPSREERLGNIIGALLGFGIVWYIFLRLKRKKARP